MPLSGHFEGVWLQDQYLMHCTETRLLSWIKIPRDWCLTGGLLDSFEWVLIGLTPKAVNIFVGQLTYRLAYLS